MHTFPAITDQRESVLDPLSGPDSADAATPRPSNQAKLPEPRLNLDPEHLASLDMDTRVSPMIARSLIETLHASIVLYDSRAGLLFESSSIAASGGTSKDTQKEVNIGVTERDAYYMKRLDAARTMGFVAGQVGDLRRLPAPMCIAVSQFLFDVRRRLCARRFADSMPAHGL